MSSCLIIAGGTFDHFHCGHASLLQKVIHLLKHTPSGHAVVGVTTDNYIHGKKDYEKHVQDFETRYKVIEAYLLSYLTPDKFTVFPLGEDSDVSLITTTYNTIVVSKDTVETAYKINQIRKERGKTPLAIYEAETIYDEDGQPISSTAIRKTMGS